MSYKVLITTSLNCTNGVSVTTSILECGFEKEALDAAFIINQAANQDRRVQQTAMCLFFSTPKVPPAQ